MDKRDHAGMSSAADLAGVVLSRVGWVAGGTRILDDVSVRFRSGQFNVVLGPNGAGKSTLLRVATGLVHPSAGSVTYDGEPLSAFDPQRLARVRAVLSQHVELAFPLPVRDVAMMGRYPHFRRVPTPRDREIVDASLALVGMSDRAAQPYSTLSGGEQQKVQLARVLAQIWTDDAGPDAAQSRFLFLDEPTSSLDVHYQLHLLDVARGLLEARCTVVAILHDLNVALRYADHVVLLDGGRVAWNGERSEEIPLSVLERVFRVKARRVGGAGDEGSLLQFTL
ncbi:MAG TPA: ATP-binding cassette domain-containing protein [Gemmatimonadaceae bacterium]